MDLRKSGISRIKQCAINASPLLRRYVTVMQRLYTLRGKVLDSAKQSSINVYSLSIKKTVLLYFLMIGVYLAFYIYKGEDLGSMPLPVSIFMLFVFSYITFNLIKRVTINEKELVLHYLFTTKKISISNIKLAKKYGFRRDIKLCLNGGGALYIIPNSTFLTKDVLSIINTLNNKT